jgi:hypothetical protein
VRHDDIRGHLEAAAGLLRQAPPDPEVLMLVAHDIATLIGVLGRSAARVGAPLPFAAVQSITELRRWALDLRASLGGRPGGTGPGPPLGPGAER